jgi:hypothetical protein
MTTFFRNIRKVVLRENRVSKYLLYAAGEIILVVIGILIALEINNWNQNKSEQVALSGYLTSISKNIKADIEKIEGLKMSRLNTLSKTPYLLYTMKDLNFISRNDLKMASEILANISNLEHFNAHLSAFESYKNSGYLSKLHGKDLEDILYKYYNLVQEISTKEKDYNYNIQNLYKLFIAKEFGKMEYISNPLKIDNDNELNYLQPYLKEILFHSSSLALYNHAFEKSPSLIIKYENLDILGKEIIRMIENDSRVFDGIALDNLKEVFSINNSKGYPKILINGTMNSLCFNEGYDTADTGIVRFQTYGINALNLEFPKVDWAVAYFRNHSNTLVERPTKDYSDYKSLKIELKGNIGGETVFIALKDDTDLDDGSETKIPLTLTSKWKTYTIPLSEFKTANLKKLYIVASFILEGKSETISIKTIEYIK